MFKVQVTMFALALIPLTATGCLGESDPEAVNDQELSATTNASVPRHALSLCQSASFYANYDSAQGPSTLKRTLPFGDKIGHTPGEHPVYNGWAATFDFGPNDWGYMRIECIGAYDSW